MSLADRAVAPRSPSMHGKKCSIGAVVEAVADDPAESAALHRILYELGLNATEVYDRITAEKYEIGRQSINKHRGKKCRCFASER